MNDATAKIARRTLLRRAAGIGIGTWIASTLGTQPAHAGKTPTPIHGVCWLGGKDCKVTYVDLGVEPRKTKGEPIYQFPSSDTNPLDTGGNYNPRRLQNNTFAGGGRDWLMFSVESGSVDLFASTNGTQTIFSTRRAPAGSPSRDLTTDPFKSQEEVFAARDRGEVVVTALNVVVDCPITDPDPGDVVVDLNPGFTFCKRSA